MVIKLIWYLKDKSTRLENLVFMKCCHDLILDRQYCLLLYVEAFFISNGRSEKLRKEIVFAFPFPFLMVVQQLTSLRYVLLL